MGKCSGVRLRHSQVGPHRSLWHSIGNISHTMNIARPSIAWSIGRAHLVLAALCASTVHLACDDSPAEPQAAAAAVPKDSSRPADKTRSPASSSGDTVHDLLLDVAAHKVCPEIEDTFTSLSPGTLWIESCSAARRGNEIHIQLGGRGWRYVDRGSSKLGAKLEVSQHLRFKGAIEATGKLETAYAPDTKTVTLRFLPGQKTSADIEVVGDVEVDGESLWGEIVQTAGEVVTDPSQKARDKAEEKGAGKTERKLASGLSAVVDLCSGQLYTEEKALPAGKIPAVALKPGGKRLFVENEWNVIRKDGLLVRGPFKKGKPPRALVKVDGRSQVTAQLTCFEDAVRVADAFFAGRDPGIFETLDKKTGNDLTLSARHPECDTALIITTDDDRADLRLAVFSQNSHKESWVACSKGERAR